MQQSLEAHVTELKHLTDTLQERGKVLRDAYNRAQEANRMKTSFLHHMTNQMIAPSAAIKESVAHLCDNYHDVSLQEANHEVEVIQQQSKAIIDLVNTLIHTAESENRKEADDE
jgi:methyl-accepting chemotaxis protein/sigma-B regulation protein RsbU (phosphoserine phosphatase)